MFPSWDTPTTRVSWGPRVNMCTGYWASLLAQTVKNPPEMQETRVGSLGWEDPHSNILAWRTPMDRGAWLVTVRGVT